jgi:hypothetical protein
MIYTQSHIGNSYLDGGISALLSHWQEQWFLQCLYVWGYDLPLSVVMAQLLRV